MSEWTEAADPETGKQYWYNEDTGQASWSDPNWQQAFDEESGNWYWFHNLTQDSSWETPDGVDEDELAALGLAPGVAAASGRRASVYEAPPDDLLAQAKEELRAKYAKQYLTHKFLRSNVPLLADATPDEAMSLAKHFKLKTLTPESKMFEEVRAQLARRLQRSRGDVAVGAALSPLPAHNTGKLRKQHVHSLCWSDGPLQGGRRG